MGGFQCNLEKTRLWVAMFTVQQHTYAHKLLEYFATQFNFELIICTSVY